ncbi:DEAD/DEAH box helicase [Flavobacterium sp. UBA7680]|uniref:DEAD/DEAH box helicase n=1 Tax=Flavobacterium sp. UBA7680 TaxID=1946559 RepID=UPI0025C7071A|nr:DEAD/DEAH box helicase family protein [Flavobacterium sp. UBA7680]
MELKPYQKQVIDHLNGYFNYLQEDKHPAKAFNRYWEDKAGMYNPLSGDGMRPYKDNVPEAVHLSIKVPTAGGKTFIACNAIKTIFDAMPHQKTKAVVWLVPWSNLLDQTVKNLSDPDHPYCQKLNSLFNNRLSVYEKKDLLQGASFNPSIVQEQLSIMVLNFASVRAKNKDDRKIFEQNGALAVFSQTYKNKLHVLENTDETALINVIRSLNPILVVDESHNAESDLSVEMLQNLNPSFILDLTATPKENANVISLVSAMELKKENMVKLPVIVYNHESIEGVIESAIHLQHKLETEALEMQANGGKYIRPIVLFQAQSKGKEENMTFHKLKQQLIKIGINEEKIKIKTADINELKQVDLLSKDCPVRYIITVNALKEGWDCPFAYILASLADRSSQTDVTQILGRVLRQPYVMKHKNPMLNVSYVLTSSSKFHETLNSIIKGLQDCGFSENDYRGKDVMPENIKEEITQTIPENKSQKETKQPFNEITEIFDPKKISVDINTKKTVSKPVIADIESIAIKQSQEMDQQISNQDDTDYIIQNLSELGIKATYYKMRESVEAQAKQITLPKFIIKVKNLEKFDLENDSVLLDRANLLKGFKLSDKGHDIKFESIVSELYKIDTEEIRNGEYRMSSYKFENPQLQEQVAEYILAKPKEGQVKDIMHRVVKQIGDMYPIPDADIKKYVGRILEDMSTEQLRDFLQHQLSYTDLIKQKIKLLADGHAELIFNEWIDIGKINTQTAWKLPAMIIPVKTSANISNSLYTHEGDMNGLELQFIMEIANYPNIAFWHRNLGKGKGFSLNGYKSEHYPDFILVTKNNKVILVETKGGDRDNSDSEAKLRLGKKWAELSGPDYKYLMVFDKNAIEGAYNLDKAKELIKQM